MDLAENLTEARKFSHLYYSTLQFFFLLPQLSSCSSKQNHLALVEVDGQAGDMFFRLVEQYAAAESVTEALKAVAPME